MRKSQEAGADVKAARETELEGGGASHSAINKITEVRAMKGIRKMPRGGPPAEGGRALSVVGREP